jgi:hypothetical protein
MGLKRINRIAGALLLAAATALAGCSALTGATTSTPSNPTGSPIATVAPTTLQVSLPLHSMVAANCAAGDVNSCTQESNITAFCKVTTTIQEPFKACVSAGWPTT